MPVRKSIIDVEVNEERFKAFQASFQRHQTELAKSPGIWKEVGKESQAVAKGFQAATAALLAQQEIGHKEAANQNSIAKASQRTAGFWGSIKKDATSVKNTLAGVGASLLKWDVIGTAVSGVLGIGGLWGAAALAGRASQGLRSSTGLGLGYGEQTAFGNVYGRVVDPGSFLRGVSSGKGNLASPEAASLYALGLNPQGGGNTGQTAVAALTKIRQLALQTPDDQLGILLQSHGLSNLGLGTEDLRRIKGLTPDQFDKYSQQYGKRTQQFGLDKDTLEKWQDFSVSLDAAEQKLKTGLIDGLVKLTGPLEKVTEGLSDAARALLGSEGFKWGVEQVAKGLEWFGRYVGTPQFKDDIVSLGTGVANMARAIGGFVRMFGGGTPGNTGGAPPGGSGNRPVSPGTANADFINKSRWEYENRWRRGHGYSEIPYDQWMREPAGGAAATTQAMSAAGGGPVGQSGFQTDRYNNPLSMMPGGQMATYSTPEEGLRAAHANLLYYQDKLGKNTIRDIINTWTPKGHGANDPDSVIRDIVASSGYGPDQKLDMRNSEQASRVMSGIAARENNYGHGSQYTPAAVKVVIENNTGGNVNTQVSQAGFPQ